MSKFLNSLFMHPIEITLPLHVLGTVGHLLAVAVLTHGTLPPDQPPQLRPPWLLQMYPKGSQLETHIQAVGYC